MKKKPFAVIVVIAVALVVGAGALLLSTESRFIPDAFTEGRNKGAQSVQTIAEMIDESLKALKEISDYDRRGDLASAVYLINKELTSTSGRQEEARSLASAMEQMARAIPEIKPTSAQQTALEAVSAQVAAVSRLVTYNQYLADLFNLLQQRVRGEKNATTEKVQKLVEKLNDEASAINELNAQFSKSLAQFDAIFKIEPAITAAPTGALPPGVTVTPIPVP